MKQITESGMTFGPFEDDQFFYIEKSEVYRRVQEGIKVAEFTLIRKEERNQPLVWIVEAKSSSPQPSNKIDFDDYIQEIKQKLLNAFSLTVATVLKRHYNDLPQLPGKFKKLNLTSANFVFILVIKGHKES